MVPVAPNSLGMDSDEPDEPPTLDNPDSPPHPISSLCTLWQPLKQASFIWHGQQQLDSISSLHYLQKQCQQMKIITKPLMNYSMKSVCSENRYLPKMKQFDKHWASWVPQMHIVSGDTLKTLSPSRSPTILPPLPLQLYIFPHTDDISTSSRCSNCIINQTQSETGRNPAPTITISGNPIVVVFLHCSPIPLFVDVYSLWPTLAEALSYSFRTSC